MWRSLCALTPFGSGWCALLEQRVGTLDHRPDDALAGVVLVTATAGRRRENEVLGPGGGAGVTVADELIAQNGQDVDLTHPGLGLGVADGDAAVGEVDVLPAQRRGLSDGEDLAQARR